MTANFKRLVILATALVVALVVWLSWHNAPINDLSKSQSAHSDKAHIPADPAVMASTTTPNKAPDQLQDPAMAFAGSESCAECHPDQYQDYQQTLHARSFRRVDVALEPPDGKLEHESSGRSYRVYRKGNEFRHREKLRVAGNSEVELADYPVRFVVGSGHHAWTYLVETDGFLVESPVTWYTSQNAWQLSPGFEAYNTGFARAVRYECLFCHASRVRTIDGNRNRLAIDSMSIDCERCHGAGGKHVAQQRADSNSTAGGDVSIVNPSRLAREQRDDLCAQCHLHSAAQSFVQGRRIEEFQPGLALADFRVDYVLQEGEQHMTVTGHAEQLFSSRCYQRSNSLTCVTCHNPHCGWRAEEKVRVYREKCLACHEDCRLEYQQRLVKSPQDSCIQCHMPATPTDIPHVAAHQHRIGIHREGSTENNAGRTPELIAIRDISRLSALESERCKGLAYLNLSLETNEPARSNEFRQQAQLILDRVVQNGVNDPETLAGLAQTHLRRDPKRSIELARQSLAAIPNSTETRIKALFVLTDSLIALGDTGNAIQPLEELVSLRRQASDWYLLSVCRYRAGNIQEALVAAQRAVQIRPDRPMSQALLSELYTHVNRADLAEKHDQLRQLLSPTETSPPSSKPFSPAR